MRVIFDASVADAWQQLGLSDKERLHGDIRIGRCEPRCHVELLEECLCIGATPIAEQLPALAKWLRVIMHGGMFRYFGETIMAELRDRGVNVDVYMARSEVCMIGRILDEISAGNIPLDLDSLKAESLTRKSVLPNFHRERQILFRKHIPRFPKESSQLSYADFRYKHWDRIEPKLLEDLLMKSGEASPKRRAAEVMQCIVEYPHWAAYLRAHAALAYLYYAQNRRIEDGDVYDVCQLVYLVDADCIVTDDVKLREECELVWGREKRAISFRQYTLESACES